MNDYMDFGQCLALILSALNIKGSQLARAINIDNSLVNRWINGSRVPSYNSDYIKIITNYICSSIINSFQEEIICDTLDNICYIEKCDNVINIHDKVLLVLTEAQGFSIERRKKVQSRIKSTPPSQNPFSLFSVKWETKSIDTKNNRFNINSELLLKDHYVPTFKDVKKPFPSNADFDTKLLKGESDVLECILCLLQTASQINCKKDEPILITFNSEAVLSFIEGDFYKRLKDLISNILKNGWKVVTLVKINNNVYRTFDVIESILSHFATGSFIPYYTKNSNLLLAHQDIIVVPGVGAMQCFGAKADHSNNFAFYYKSAEVVNNLASYFNQLISFAKPLLKIFSSKKNEFLKEVVDAEEKYGNRYLFKDGLSSLSISLRQYEEYLNSLDTPINELREMVEYHNRRLYAFSANIKHFKYRDICIKESVERLLFDKKYHFVDFCFLRNPSLTSQNIKEQIHNVINMLEKYDNYEIALVNKSQYAPDANFYWMVKDSTAVLAKSVNLNDPTDRDSALCNSEIGVTSEEPSIVDAMGEYLSDLWEDISPVNKDKETVIAWFKCMLDII